MQAPFTPVPGQYGISIFIPDDVIARESRNCFLYNLSITKIGRFDHCHGHFIRRYNVNEYILLYCTEGKGWAETCGVSREVGPGDLVLLDINQPHAYGADDRDPWCIYWVHFTGAGVPELYRLLNISPQSAILAVGVRPELISLLKEASKILSEGYSLPNLFSGTTCLQEFFCHLVKGRMHTGMCSDRHMDLKSVIDHMVNNLYGKFTLNELAANTNMSKYHFVRRFKQTTGYSPMEYFNRLKIQKACELLDTTSLDIKDISEFLSFSNPFYFSEVFKRIIGHSPKNYRTLQKTGHIPE